MVIYSLLTALALAASEGQAATYTFSFVPDDAVPYQEWITLDYDDGTAFRLSDSFTRDTVPNPPVRNSLYQTSDTALRYALELELSPGWTSIYTSQFAETGGICVFHRIRPLIPATSDQLFHDHPTGRR